MNNFRELQEAYLNEDFAPLSDVDKKMVIGRFYEKSHNKLFEYALADDPWAKKHGLLHKLYMTNKEFRFANVKKTVAEVAVDENDGGTPKIEKWKIKQHVVYTYESIKEARAMKGLRIYIPTLNSTVVGDAINILSKIRVADKFTSIKKFEKVLGSQEYFSLSQSNAYQQFGDKTPDVNSVIAKEVGDLVAAWDDVNGIGYIIPNSKLYRENQTQIKGLTYE